MLCNPVLQRWGRRADGNLCMTVCAECMLALEPGAKDRVLHPDPSVSAGKDASGCNLSPVHKGPCCVCN